MQHPDRFYPVVDSIAWLKRLTALGVGTVQLRAKDLEHADAVKLMREALAVTHGTGTNLVVNDYWQAAIEAKAQHLHLGQEDLVDADVKAIRRAGLKLGVSTHDHAELEKGLAVDPDYVALGPVWPTALKKMPWAPQGLDRLGEWKKLIGNRPLVAIGGLTLERALLCLEAGADSAAVVGDIVNNPDPVAQAKAWIAATRVAA